MLEYDTEEALALLEKNFNAARENLAEVTKQMDFLRDQTTTTEVRAAHSGPHHLLQKAMRSGMRSLTGHRGLRGWGGRWESSVTRPITAKV